MIALWIIAAHMAGDYLFQTNWMATNKLTDWSARARHVTVYALCFIPVAIVYAPNLSTYVAFLVLLWITHFLIDSKRWRTSNPWPAMPILHDQALHAVQLAILVSLFLR